MIVLTKITIITNNEYKKNEIMNILQCFYIIMYSVNINVRIRISYIF